MMFKMKDLGRATNIVGINIEYTEEGIAINQKRYIESVLKRFGMENAKSAVTPSDVAQKLLIKMIGAGDSALENIPYQQAVGCLLYLVQGTRPDIAFAVNDVSRFNSSHAQPHWTAVKRIMRYLSGTLDYKILNRYGGGDLVGFTDVLALAMCLI